jgi:site-specific DNA-methyltransferase (adenine-specific)
MIEMLNCDCMEYMAGLADKAFDLAIVDPPYGIGASGSAFISGKSGIGDSRWKNRAGHKYEIKEWDDSAPTEKYFSELFRVSKNQIIWGGNHFILPVSSCWIFWDKMTGGCDFSDGELAWCSFDLAIRKFEYLWSGFRKQYPESRIHPTQKPIALYKWLLSRYAKPGDRILDTHGGSGSICIACHDLGYDLTWMELDADYYKAAVARYQNHAAQASLFDPAELTKATETTPPELFSDGPEVEE